MRIVHLLAVAAMLLPATAMAAPRVEVIRFHTPDTLASIGAGSVAVVAGPGLDANSLEDRVWLDAVADALAGMNLAATVNPNAAPRVAEVVRTRDVIQGSDLGRPRSGVSVGVGVGSGGGGYYGRRGGTNVGLGVGFSLGGGSKSREEVDTELAVTIRDKASGAPLWEGRSSLRVQEGSKDDETGRVARRLADALFKGFPGRSGETIEVK